MPKHIADVSHMICGLVVTRRVVLAESNFCASARDNSKEIVQLYHEPGCREVRGVLLNRRQFLQTGSCPIVSEIC